MTKEIWEQALAEATGEAQVKPSKPKRTITLPWVLSSWHRAGVTIGLIVLVTLITIILISPLGGPAAAPAGILNDAAGLAVCNGPEALFIQEGC